MPIGASLMMSAPKRQLASNAQAVPRPKKVKRQTEYHSSSSDSEEEAIEHTDPGKEDEQSNDESPEESDNAELSGSLSPSSGAESEDENTEQKKNKRNDPAAFATSISKILNAKLTTSKRIDPVLSRSKDASNAAKEMSEARLEAKAKQKLRDDKRAKLETGRIKDVLGLNNPEISTEDMMEQEKKYKKIAQRGVVRMFNAIRAAQVMGEQAARDAQTQGVVGIDKREQKVNEMSKKGFLELIAGGGKK
jgi:mitochondrial fusion and transport protein UGO1